MKMMPTISPLGVALGIDPYGASRARNSALTSGTLTSRAPSSNAPTSRTPSSRTPISVTPTSGAPTARMPCSIAPTSMPDPLGRDPSKNSHRGEGLVAWVLRGRDRGRSPGTCPGSSAPGARRRPRRGPTSDPVGVGGPQAALRRPPPFAPLASVLGSASAASVSAASVKPTESGLDHACLESGAGSAMIPYLERILTGGQQQPPIGNPSIEEKRGIRCNSSIRLTRPRSERQLQHYTIQRF